MKQKIVILGAGESGIGAALLAKKEGYDVFVSDQKSIDFYFRILLEEARIKFEQGKHTEEIILTADQIIKSPGIPSNLPIVRLIKEKGIPIISEIEFAYRYTDAKIIAITGTNGKTTTTLLTYHLLKSAGLNVGLAGNVGVGFARSVAKSKPDWFVLEVSSFQLDDIQEFRPKIAALLNITPDHLDRYSGSMEQYAAAKYRIIENLGTGDMLVYNADDEWVCRGLNRIESPLFRQEPFTAAMCKDGVLEVPIVAQLSADLEGFTEPTAMRFANLPLPGQHNAMNITAAIMIARAAGLTESDIRQHLPTFQNTEHRMELVANIHGIKFYNDSKATNVEAAWYALDSFDTPIIWIAGGQDKGNDYQQLIPLVKQKVKAMICLGLDNAKLIDVFGELVPYHLETQSVTEAVTSAYHFAEKGDIVLLSPACASFDFFENFAARGKQFREAAQKLQKEMIIYPK